MEKENFGAVYCNRLLLVVGIQFNSNLATPRAITIIRCPPLPFQSVWHGPPTHVDIGIVPSPPALADAGADADAAPTPGPIPTPPILARLRPILTPRLMFMEAIIFMEDASCMGSMEAAAAAAAAAVAFHPPRGLRFFVVFFRSRVFIYFSYFARWR